MLLRERKIPKWKEKEEAFKNHSFDDALETLGTNGEFINAKEIDRKIKSPTKKVQKVICEDN